MDEQTATQVRYLLEAMEINMSPVVNVRPWFPTAEGMVTFRVATADRDLHYVSLPQGFSLQAEVSMNISGVKCMQCHTMVAASRFNEHACCVQ